MNSTDIPQPTLQDDLKYYWMLIRHLADADRSGDAKEVFYALRELDDFTFVADPSPVRSRAANVVASRGFHALSTAAD